MESTPNSTIDYLFLLQLIKAIQDGINRVNSHATSNAQKVQKWVVLPKDFSVPGGELGPTLKLKRNVVVDMYKDVIAKLYVDDTK